jgi:hypothetical protein
VGGSFVWQATLILGVFMKNVLALSLLCTALVSASLRAEQPCVSECSTAAVANDPFLCISEDGKLMHKTESVDADGHIHVLIAVDAFDCTLEVGDIFGTIGGATYRILSIEPSEDPAYLRVVLLVASVETTTIAEQA